MQTATTSTDAASDCEITDAKSEPENGTQMDLFEENFLKRDIRAEYKLIGQVFDTYWLVEFKDTGSRQTDRRTPDTGQSISLSAWTTDDHCHDKT